ncbi:hypothetical protein [Pyxidicoccus xibeiensis]|uniref:hypothetical protein n=1 Tax=Pyxidicoccus xibeiensis TaxID=2906759 RepID=UPI0020A7D4F7|nr:hypothetical protein [Pyxidicoccus xibeiensis]MCP3141597.1 hypothetical protein [Pyxidicoccus xibeiensis]
MPELEVPRPPSSLTQPPHEREVPPPAWAEPAVDCGDACDRLWAGKSTERDSAEFARFGRAAFSEMARLVKIACADGQCAPQVNQIAAEAERLKDPSVGWEPQRVAQDSHASEELDAPGGVAEFVTSSGAKVAVRCLRLTDVIGDPLRCGISFQSGTVSAEYFGHGVDGASSIWIDSGGHITYRGDDGARTEGSALATRPVPERSAERFVPPPEPEPAPPVARFEGLVHVGSFVLGTSVPLVAGSLGAGRMHDQRFLRMGGQALGGATLSLLPSMWLDEGSPWQGWGPGGTLRLLEFSAGVVTAPLLGAAGTWGTGMLLQGSRNPAAAFGGALAGAFVGALLSLGVNYLLREFPVAFQPARLGLTVGFIGSGATVGYDLLGGGPR